jgi:hypothetical protein
MPTPQRRTDFHVEHELSAWLSRYRLNKLNNDVGFAEGKGGALAKTPWTQRAVAERAGFSRYCLCQYENQRITPGSFEIWVRWARALGLTFSANIISNASSSHQRRGLSSESTNWTPGI